MNANHSINCQSQSEAKRSSGQSGPTSIPGKKRSSMNALKTGLYAKSKLLPFEDEKRYRRHVRDTFESLLPENAFEKNIVQDIADAMWRAMRVELRSGLYHEEVLKQLTPEKMAEFLGIQGKRRSRAPGFLLIPNHRIPKKELPHLQKCYDQYQHLLTHVQGIKNYQMIWRQYPDLFMLLHEWLIQRGRAPLYMPNFEGLTLGWQQCPRLVEDCLAELTDELWYVLNFERLKPKIRHSMAVWFFLQTRESHHMRHINELLLRERRTCYELLDQYMKLRKSRLVHGIWQAHAIPQASQSLMVDYETISTKT